MFCEKCGTQMEDNQEFCTNCGAKLTDSNEFQPSSKKGAKLYDYLVIAFAALMVLGTLLPVYTIEFWGLKESVSYIEGDGIFILIFAVVAFVLYALNKDKFMAIPAALSILLLIFFTSEINKVGGFGSWGIGYFVMWIGAIATLILPFTPFAKEKGLFIKK